MVRFQNKGYFNRIASYIFPLMLFAGTLSFAQQVQEPKGCLSPLVGTIGGNFEFATSASTVNGNVCIPTAANSVNVEVVPINSDFRAYIFNATDASDFANGFAPLATNPNYPLKIEKEGIYWVAMQDKDNAGNTYQRCKKLTVKKIQPVTATILTCGASVITVNIPPRSDVATNNHDRYVINWGDGSPTETRASTTTPLVIQRLFTPTNQVSVQGDYLDGAGSVLCNAPAISKKPDPSSSVYINKVAKKANRTEYDITFRDFAPGKVHKVEYAESTNPGNFVQATGDFTNGNATISGLDGSKDYCFRMSYTDNCGVPSKSSTVCSMTLTGQVLSATDAELTWTRPVQPTSNLTENILEKDNVNCPTISCFNELALSSPTARRYVYDQLDCGKVFTFTARNKFSIMANGGLRTIEVVSNTVTIDPASSQKPPPPNDPVAVSYVSEKEVNITIYQFTSRTKYNFFRASGGTEDYRPLATTSTNNFVDKDVNPEKEKYCYKYTYEDACGRTSELSAAFCTIFLNSKSPTTIDWTAYTIPGNTNTSPVEYRVELIDPTTGFGPPIANTADLSFNVESLIANAGDSEIQFRIVGTKTVDIEGRQFPIRSNSNIYTFSLPPALFVPSAFTPNGDGINDVFKAEFRFVDSAIMRVYDRWGSIMFESDDLDGGWDGTVGSGLQRAAAGTYVYRIEAKETEGRVTVKTGSVTLLR